ncbi:hypothetical protein A3F66_00735 [candidate division TM6 bacterium RIFCSPHIGHO2_12_FULL_32_22]|nr:MAG: hypothetical protein A3F66_00735 [candidate division TM6 bacterium RIFCSPHIGHO2_12_FULL_32_22]
MKKILLLYTFLFSTFGYSKEESFVDSFIKSCDFSAQGRYARGYPPYLAQKAKTSLEDLEKAIRSGGIHINDRILVSGYEQNAVPSYKFDLVKKNIDDEANIKTASGWSFAPGNLFGFITGFLFKDANVLKQKAKIFEHINPENVEIFAPNTELLQKHAFGDKVYEDLTDYRESLNRSIENSNSKNVLKILIHFWKWLYADGKKSKQGGVIGTQDIIFSILYSTYLCNSEIPIYKFFIGPDITYPIRVLKSQPVEATINSQTFVKRIVEELVPRNNKKTGYIFGSFVDGVGKSTLMGNIVNWQKYKNDFRKYEAVDNSSSQLATIHPFTDDVFIVDLPAQMSHFCAKPDGHVFVDLKACKMDEQVIKNITEFLSQNLEKLILDFIEAMQSTKNSSIRDDNSFYERYVKNVVTLKVTPAWIPFVFENNTYVFNAENPNEIRQLVSFDEAHSSGLKAKEPELMIFEGATIPMSYEIFLEDLITRMKESGIEEVVFVDFISMYPRSSRENVRINFMLHQLCELFGNDFDIEKSLYRNFVHNHEIYSMLKKYKDELIDSVVLETIARTTMNDAILYESAPDIKKLTFEQLIDFMQVRLKEMDFGKRKQMFDFINGRIDEAFKEIKHYKFGKIVESCWNVKLDKIEALSIEITKIFSKELGNKFLSDEWSGLEEISEIDSLSNLAIFRSGEKGYILAEINEDMHDPIMLGKIFNALRLTHFLTFKTHLQNSIAANTVLPALLIRKYEDSYYLIQKKSRRSVAFERYDTIDTSKKDYLFGYDADDMYNGIVMLLLDAHDKYEQMHENKSDFFVTTSELVALLDKYNEWDFHISRVRQSANMIGFPAESVNLDPNLSLILRALATQESLLKISKMDIMARDNSQEDFVATIKLLEKITLPTYFSIKHKNSIFENYYTVEPIVKLDWKSKN